MRWGRGKICSEGRPHFGKCHASANHQQERVTAGLEGLTLTQEPAVPLRGEK